MSSDDRALEIVRRYETMPAGPEKDALRAFFVRMIVHANHFFAEHYDQLPLCPWCHQPDDECRCAFMWKDGERVPLPGRATMTPPNETNPPRRA